MRESSFSRIGRFAARWPWLVIGGWAVVLVVMGSFAGGLSERLSGGGFDVPGSESLAVKQDLAHRFTRQFSATGLVVVHEPHETVDSPSFRDALQRVGDRLASVEGVDGVASFATTGNSAFVSPDRHTTYVVVGVTGTDSEQAVTGGRIIAVVEDVRASVPGFEVLAGGAPTFLNRFNEVGREDLEEAELVSFPVTLLVLVVAFSSVVAAGLPVLLALVSLVVTLGILFFLAGRVDMSIYVTNTASVLGIGVGIDYALFVVTRFREELRRGHDVPRAVEQAVATSGQAVALSGITVVVALAGMFLVDVQAFSSMAIGSMTVVAVAVLVAITLLPAVLRLVGRRIDRLQVPSLFRSGGQAGGFWHRWAVTVMRRPWLSIAASLALLVPLALPVSGIRLGPSSPSMLPADEMPRLATERLAQAFGEGVVGPLEVLVEMPGGAGRPENLAKIDRLTRAVAADPAVSQVVSLTSVIPGADLATYERAYAGGLAGLDPRLAPVVDGLVNWDRGTDLARITVIGKDAPEAAATERLLDRVRDRYIAEQGLKGAVRVGGTPAANVDLSRRLAERLPLVVGSVLALSFVLLVMAFRSLVVPTKAILMNLLSVGAAYGLLVAIFQNGWGEQLLGFRSEGNITSYVPLFLFTALFGLSMDYEVFLMSRMKEEYEATGSNELAVARGLEATARTITSAALVMVTVFAAFAAGSIVVFKEIGVGLAAAIFLDATVVRALLVPAAMKLMGRWNWWMPAALERVLPRLALERSSEREQPAVVTRASD